MFDSRTDHLNWVNISRQLFCNDFRTNPFFLGWFLHRLASKTAKSKLFQCGTYTHSSDST